MMDRLISFLLCVIPVGMTFLYGAVGEIIVEKVGHLNLGIPGIMCMGGAGGCVALSLMSSNGTHPVIVVTVAILASFLTGGAMGLLYSFLTVSLRSNQNVTGLVMTIFGVGLTNFIMAGLKWEKCSYALSYFRYPFEGTDWMYCGCMVWLAIAIALTASFVLSKTRVGLNLRAVGENPATADAVGINVTGYKYVATCIGCGIAALGGLFYIMDYAGSQEAYKSIEPMGWLAVALVIFTLWRPALTIFGSMVFGGLYIISTKLPSFFPQVFGADGFLSPLSRYELLRHLPLMIIMTFGATPLPKRIYLYFAEKGALPTLVHKLILPIAALALSVAYIVNSGYNPFLYFRF